MESAVLRSISPSRRLRKDLQDFGIRAVFTLDHKVMQVHLTLTPREWCNLCQVDGSDYLPTEGSLPEAQKILALAFQQAGWLTARQLQLLIFILQGNKGFEEFLGRPSMMNCNQGWREKLHWIWHSVKEYI